MLPIPIRRIARIALTVADLNGSTHFFQDALGFEAVGRERHTGGTASANADVVVMRLGQQQIELTAFDQPGQPYPTERSAADPWFQHFAIVVSDMAAAYAMLGAAPSWTPISTNGPQLLPPETGGIVAFKFRDPDGHPLELSWFPPAIAGAWADVRSLSPFLGIDHSALTVVDGAASTAFYTERLGFTPTGRQTNTGPVQAALDGLPGATVEITSLGTPHPGPHIELLCYQRQSDRLDRVAINDVASTRLILEAGPAAAAELLADPDGHFLEIRALL